MVAAGSLTGAPGAGLQRGQWVPASPPLPQASHWQPQSFALRGQLKGMGRRRGDAGRSWAVTRDSDNDQTLRYRTSRHRLGSRHLRGWCRDPTSQGAWGKQGSGVLLSPPPAPPPPQHGWAKGPASPARDRAAPSTWAEGRQSNPNSRQGAELLAPRPVGAPPSSAGNGKHPKGPCPPDLGLRPCPRPPS